jgi:hypothetical protein
MARHKNPFSETALFIIVKANRDNPHLSHEVEKVKGRGHAEKRVEQLDGQLKDEDKAAGWYYYLK